MRRVPPLACLVLMHVLALGLPQDVAAQAQVLDVINEGKPSPDVPVVLASEDGEEQVAETDTDGTASLDLSILNLGKGTRVTVYARQCSGGEVAVVLQAEGVEADPCADAEAESGEGCECNVVGTFVAGGGPVMVDVGAGRLVQTASTAAEAAIAEQAAEPIATPSAQPPALASDPSPDFRLHLGVQAHYAVMPKLEDACGTGAGATCETDATTTAYSGFAELVYRQRYYLGLNAWATRPVEFSQMYDLGPVDGKMTTRGLDIYGGVRVPVDRLTFRWSVAWGFHRNKGTFVGDGGSMEREQSGGRMTASAGVDAPLIGNLGLRFGYDFVTAGSDDADTAHRFGLGLSYAVPIRVGR